MDRTISFQDAINVIAKMQRDQRIAAGENQYIIHLVANTSTLEEGPFDEYEIEQFSKFKVYYSPAYQHFLDAYVTIPGSTLPIRLEDFLLESGMFTDYIQYFDLEQQKEASLSENQTHLAYPKSKI